ncbi:MAG: CusA/CzcA family heavy metal efflux RND transporter [Nitrospira sp.]|jgi:cobalt-zinc-cadmium resistance protein CzcA|nr:efflux RND transporter permease subunit [Nitrospira sp.]MCW5788702.1 efflux RND transporter permease subunit [Nitrospira sp.]MDR4477415.1 CusA/CzcA family heavy metal efflux RND transporter [Nitrospira sp.]
MLSSLLAFALRQRVLVVVMACILTAGGIYAFRTIAIDAFPDVTTVLVQVVTKVPGMSPAEVERFVTFPMELQLMGAPGLTDIRSFSKVGLSMITVVFKDDIDIYLARQVVLERILEIQELLPPGSTSQLVPNTTGLGEVYQFYLEGPHDHDKDFVMSDSDLMERRTIEDWVIRPLLKGLPDVVDVNSLGGFVKQYQVMVEPGLLRKYGLALHDVFDAVAKNNANAGGNILEKDDEKYVVRGVGLIKTLEDIDHIVVKQVGGTPVYVRDVAEVRIGHAVRHGAAVLNGKHEVITGIVLMLRGGNARDVVQSIKDKISEIHHKRLLPDGLRIIPFYDRIELITAALDTVYKALLEGIVLVVVILFLFLGNVRSALIVTATLIVTPLVTFIIMDQVGLTANLMSLGGLVIAIGMMVDGSVVVVENVYRHLAEQRDDRLSKTEVILHAVTEVGQPVIFGILIIILVFLPILTLQGMEGKMFQPLANTIIIALLVSLVLSLTLSPVLCAMALKRGTEEDTFLLRWAKWAYLPTLRWATGHRVTVLALALGLLGASLSLFPFLGGEFIPILNEGSISPQTIRYPSIALDRSIEIEKEMQRAVMEFPEVRMVVSKIGRSEMGNDPQEPNASDPTVTLRPMDEWTTAKTKAGLDDAIRKRIEKVPGANYLLSQPIQQRVDELLSGVRSEATIKILGDDLSVLRSTAEKIQTIMASVRGVGDVRVEQLFGQTYLTIDIDRSKIARHGINVAHIQEIITTAIGQEPATHVYEGNKRFDLTLRYPEKYRNSVDTIKNILLTTSSGALIPLGDLATVELQEGPSLISREGLQRRIYVGFNTLGRDIESVVAEAQAKIAKEIHLPAGYHLVWGGSFENMQRAMARLKIILPITIGLIFMLLFASFNSVRHAALIIMNLPFAMIGGIVALWLTGEYLSVPASVGFINLFGVAVLNGIVLVSYFNKLREDGLPCDEAIIKGCTLRLRPVLMTALVALLGLMPLAFAHGIGSEVQRPLAVVVIGGLVSSTLLTLIVLPVLYQWFDRPDAPGARSEEQAT